MKSSPDLSPLNNRIEPQGSVREVVEVFLRLGFTAFGGPVAHIALFRDEVVKRRQWVSDEEFLDLLGATNFIPGPNSTEMTIHLGYIRAGWKGLIAGGVCFILPAFLIVLALAVAYVEYGSTPAATALLYGIKPVIIAVILNAMWALAPKAAKTRLLAGVGIAAFALYLLGVNELLLMFGLGIAVMLYQNRGRLRGFPMIIGISPGVLFQSASSNAVAYSHTELFLTFLKIGSVLYGSGYVLLAFLQNDFVERLGWLTQQQLLDAVAIGQFTPGPLFTTATFIGYVMGGFWGAILATVGIFLPSFIFVAITNPLIPRLRRSPWFGALLDGVNVAALGLMAGVTFQLGIAALVDVFTVGLALVAALMIIRFKINPTWLILGGGILGVLVKNI